jgi:hypothetical protein
MWLPGVGIVLASYPSSNMIHEIWHNQDGNNQGNPVLARSLTAAELFPDPAEDEESSEDERIMHENIDVQARMDLVINNNPPLARSLTAAELFPDPVSEPVDQVV